MPFKWVQCRICARTGHIGDFPEPHHKRLKKTGVGVCKRCDGFTYSSRLASEDIDNFLKFIEATSEG